MSAGCAENADHAHSGLAQRAAARNKDTFMTLVREEGWRGLFYGVVPRVVWISLGGALWFGAFEEYRRQLQRFMWCVFPTNSLHA